MLGEQRMSTRLKRATGAFFVFGMAMFVTDAQAQTFYLGGEAGWNVLENQTDRTKGHGTALAKFDSGFAAGARAGYEWGPWRFEEEYVYRSNDLNRLTVGAVKVPGASGGRQSHALMTNVIYDVDIGWPVTPHVGAGIGAVNIIDHARASGIGHLFNDDDWVFGYQAIGGVRYNFNPQVALDLDY